MKCFTFVSRQVKKSVSSSVLFCFCLVLCVQAAFQSLYSCTPFFWFLALKYSLSESCFKEVLVGSQLVAFNNYSMLLKSTSINCLCTGTDRVCLTINVGKTKELLLSSNKVWLGQLWWRATLTWHKRFFWIPCRDHFDNGVWACWFNFFNI